jgi:outer membrane protein OmpA-like peptidoglycan-associated protein
MVNRAMMVFAFLALGAGALAAQTPTGDRGPEGQSPSQVRAQVQTPTQAQTPSDPQPPPAPAADESATRPATTTIFGDTGLWFVPTGEILPHRRWSASLYRYNYDFDPGFTDVSNWPVTFAVGVRDRAEIFGAFVVVNRIDRDVRPIFGDATAGGVVNDYPFVREGWTGNKVGDFRVGAKLNVLSEGRQEPVAFALRAMAKLPTGDDDAGASTGKADWMFDAILSKEVNERVELAGFGGITLRGDPDEFNLSNSFRWGLGAGFPTRRGLRLTTELHGDVYFDDPITASQTLTADDGSISPLSSDQHGPLNATIGLTWQHRNGFFLGGGVNWNFNLHDRSDLAGVDDETGDAAGWQLRLGYHPGVRIFVAPPPPLPPPTPPPAPEHILSVEAQCDPCTVEVGKSSTVTAIPKSSIGCVVTYRWSAPTGTFANPSVQKTPWTAPMQPGPVPVTVTVTCPSDGKTASDDVTIQVVQPKVEPVVFEDVHFDFDRYTLRPEATRALDEAVAALQKNTNLRVEIEGHTCNIGTAEYNLALGERRANAVRDYLAGRGIGADRLTTVSYGEERPKHDTAREETRRLNRRAALIVRIQ